MVPIDLLYMAVLSSFVAGVLCSGFFFVYGGVTDMIKSETLNKILFVVGVIGFLLFCAVLTFIMAYGVYSR